MSYYLILNEGVDFNIIELTGEAGDVILLHPFLLHARSKNLAPMSEHGVRFLCHPSIPLRSLLNSLYFYFCCFYYFYIFMLYSLLETYDHRMFHVCKS